MLTTLLLLTNFVFAGELADINIKVKGMVCSFCVQGVEKQFKKQDAVERVVVDLEDSVVTVWLKQGQILPDSSIGKIISDSGYDVESIERLEQSGFDSSEEINATNNVEAEKPTEEDKDAQKTKESKGAKKTKENK